LPDEEVLTKEAAPKAEAAPPVGPSDALPH
jgi:hypothetical protein